MHFLQHVPRHANGHLFITYQDVEGFDTPPPEEVDMLSCSHCQGQWIVRPGSGTQRGWCFRCAGPTCGSKACDACVPFEMALEVMESRVSLAGALHRIRGL